MCASLIELSFGRILSVCIEPLCSAGGGVAVVVVGGSVTRNTRQLCFTDAADLLLDDFSPTELNFTWI